MFNPSIQLETEVYKTRKHQKQPFFLSDIKSDETSHFRSVRITNIISIQSSLPTFDQYLVALPLNCVLA